MNKHILLYESCRLVKGYNRTCLVDQQRLKIELVDNEIFKIFDSENLEKSKSEILDNYSVDEKEIINEYFDFLIKNEYAFECTKEEIIFFPKLSLDFDIPSKISNCILDFSTIPDDMFNYQKFIQDLDNYGCENIQIRIFTDTNLNNLSRFLSIFDQTIIYRIELLLKHNTEKEEEEYKKFLKKHARVNELILHSAPFDRSLTLNSNQRLIMLNDIIIDERKCGLVSPKYFNPRQEHFFESQNHNSCLNKKISIDKNGDIKNCPSMSKSYGNIENTSLKEVISNFEFKKPWFISKYNIDVCKDCEFRYICTDCRAYLESDVSKMKPKKCKYNPYNNQWSE